MINLETLTTFFGWCSVINFALLAITALLLMVAKDLISNIHSKLMGVEKEGLADAYFGYLANYKIAIIMLNIVPYFALKLMT